MANRVYRRCSRISFRQTESCYAYGLNVKMTWVLQSLYPDHGLVVNLGAADSLFEWGAEGIARYKAVALYGEQKWRDS
jgi:hypothetical protein